MKKTNKTNYIFYSKMIIVVVLILISIIAFAFGEIIFMVQGIIFSVAIWIWFTIQEFKIELLEEISDKIKHE